MTGFDNADLTIANGTLTAVSSADGGITWTATFTPTDDLENATNVITIDNTGVTDAAGNAGQGTTDSNNCAIDTTGPTISSVALGSDEYVNAAETSAGIDILVTTTCVEDGQTVTCNVKDGDDPVNTVGPLTGNIASNAVTIASTALTSLDDGTITVSCDVSDAAGNPAVQGTDTSVKEVILPTVSSFSPADDAVNVALDANLVLTFSENVDVESGNIVIKKTSDDSAVETIDVGLAQDTGSGTETITIDPASNLAHHTEYYVQIEAACFDDAAGNSYAGLTDIDTVSWSFTTIAANTQAPESIDHSLEVSAGNISIDIRNAISLTTITVSQSISPSITLDITFGVPTTVGGKKQITTQPQNLTITRSNVVLTIPASATITDTDNTWDGEIILPTVQSNISNNSYLLSGQTIDTSFTVQVGLTNKKLVFDKAVRLLLPNQAGQRIGWNDGSASQEITTACSADTQAVGNALPIEGNCKIYVGSDLVIWTKHFTQFFVYASSPIIGGSGLPPAAYNPPAPPAEGFSILINNDVEITDSQTVTLNLQAGSDTKRMAISNFSDFQGAGQETYASTKTWTLTEGQGEKTVYAKFYTRWGRTSEIVSDTIVLKYEEVEKPIKTTTLEEIQQKIIEILEKLVSLYGRLILMLKG